MLPSSSCWLDDDDELFMLSVAVGVQASRKMKFSKKAEYRVKVLLYFCLLGLITLLILYVTVPRRKGITIRVLHTTYQGQYVGTTLLSKAAQDNFVIIRRDELNLNLGSEPQAFYKTNIILECSASAPIMWSYEGYGSPQAEVHNERKYANFNDTSSYSFTSSLNLMPISEVSSGRYICSHVSQDDEEKDFVQIFVPGERSLFVLSYDISIKANTGTELKIPCPISNPDKAQNISLFTKGEVISEKFIKSFSPSTGFILNAKYIEEGEPFSTYICQENATKQKSGKITILPDKDSLVIVHPPASIISFHPKTFNGSFACHGKENLTLKFRKIQQLKRQEYEINLSSNFPFSSTVKFEERDLKNGSVISCVTASKGDLLHSWTVSFSKLEEMSETKFYYKEDSDEFVCCGMTSNRPKLSKLDCFHPIECNIKKNCLTLGNQDNENCAIPSLKLVQRSTCVHYKVDYDQNNVSLGQLKCSTGDEDHAEFTYFNFKGQNNSIISNFFNSANPDTIYDSNMGKSPFLTIEVIYIRLVGKKMDHKYRCKGPKFYFSIGFTWQVVRDNGVEYHQGTDNFDGAWINSELQFQGGKQRVRKIYCFAPIWNSETKFAYKVLDTLII